MKVLIALNTGFLDVSIILREKYPLKLFCFCIPAIYHSSKNTCYRMQILNQYVVSQLGVVCC